MTLVEEQNEDRAVIPDPRIDWDRLLERPRLPVDHQALEAAFVGRRIIITGAAGSLGRDLACFITRYRPAALTLVDSSEAGLFALRERLLATEVDESLLSFRLADVRNRRRIAALFDRARPELVYHLAAYKHVPWAEVEPSEYLDVNLGGGRVVIEEAARHNVTRIVYPSTDKAVNPPSLYGATKRIIEEMLRETAAQSELRTVATRFVNVLGSQGSVGVIFARRIAARQPLPITDAGMTRYWIAPNHGTLLLAYAATDAFNEPATVLLPDARPAVSVIELAQRIWRQMGAEVAPEFVITGSRPGERLHEELVGETEHLEASPFAGILTVRGLTVPPSGRSIASGIGDLLTLLEADTAEDALRTRTLDWARTMR